MIKGYLVYGFLVVLVYSYISYVGIGYYDLIIGNNLKTADKSFQHK
jgi:hypothetical protein